MARFELHFPSHSWMDAYRTTQSLLARPFRERRELLRSLFIEVPNKFTWVKSLDATSVDHEIVLEFFKSALDIKCEGIMVKVLDNGVPSVSTLSLEEPSEKGKEKERNKGDRRKALLATYEPDKRLEVRILGAWLGEIALIILIMYSHGLK